MVNLQPDFSSNLISAPIRNKVQLLDAPVHNWYRFVLAYPPHLVRTYLDRFNVLPGQVVLDPFCGTGTTVVECKKRGIASIGLEANPVVQFAADAKTDWTPDPQVLLSQVELVAQRVQSQLQQENVPDEPFFEQLHTTPLLRQLPAAAMKLLLTNSISPRPLHKALVLLDALAETKDPILWRHGRLALADSLVWESSNLRFGPEVGVGKIKSDAAVLEPWLRRMRRIIADLESLPANSVSSQVLLGDARQVGDFILPNSIDAVITSPPYPNEKDYTRTTRLETVLLGFAGSQLEMRSTKKGLLRSNTRGVYREDTDDLIGTRYPEVAALANEIEARRIVLGKTSGFERLYARVTRLYFGGMARHLEELRPLLKPGASLAYVVGDQASFFRILIPTGQILARIAQSLGYVVEDIDLFRTRAATATRSHLREEVIVLRWPGNV